MSRKYCIILILKQKEYIMSLEQYMNNNFKNLSLKSPLFYNWNNGIRFDIGYLDLWIYAEKKTINYKYAKEGLVRVKSIFEFLFDEEDEIFIVSQRYSDGRQKIKKQSFCFKNIDNYSNVESFKIKDPYFDEDNVYSKTEHWHRIMFETKVKDINYEEFFRHSIEYDFRYRGGVEVYFINKSKNIIFHNYDDRGLDVIAKEPKALEALYLKYNTWILEYDRVKIAKVFDALN